MATLADWPCERVGHVSRGATVVVATPSCHRELCATACNRVQPTATDCNCVKPLQPTATVVLNRNRRNLCWWTVTVVPDKLHVHCV